VTVNCPAPQRVAGKNQWTPLVPLLLGVLTTGLASGMINTALPTIAADLGTSPGARAWMADAYPLAVAVSIVVAARLGDRFGRRRTLLAGLAGFAVLSAGALVADSTAAVVTIRALSGVAGAFLLASVVGTIGTLYRGHTVAVANGLWVAVFGAATAVGPALGGAVTQGLGWQWVFVLCAPIAAAALASAVFLVPETASRQPVSFDPWSIVCAVFGLGGIVLGLERAPQAPLTGGLVFAVGGVLLTAFLRRQRRLATPLISLDLFARPRFATSFTRIAVSAGTAVACTYLVSVHVQQDLGWSATQAGLALVPQAVATALGGLLGPVAARRFGRGRTLRLALGAQAAGLAALAWAPAGVAVPISAVGFGFGVVGSLATAELFDGTSASDSGQVGAVQEVAFAAGSGLGIAVFATVAVAGGSHGYPVATAAAAAITVIAAALREKR